MRGIYLRGKIFWFSKRIGLERFFVSLKTTDYSQAVERALKIIETPERQVWAARAMDSRKIERKRKAQKREERIFLMRVKGGLSWSMIAERIKCTHGTVMNICRKVSRRKIFEKQPSLSSAETKRRIRDLLDLGNVYLRKTPLESDKIREILIANNRKTYVKVAEVLLEEGKGSLLSRERVRQLYLEHQIKHIGWARKRKKAKRLPSSSK